LAISWLDLPGSRFVMNKRGATGTALAAVFLVVGLQAGCGGSNGAGAPPPPPTFITIDAPGATQGTLVADVNDQGEIVGSFEDTNGVSHGFLRNSDGTITVFDAPGAGTQLGMGTHALGITDSGVIVGFFDSSAAPPAPARQGFVRDTQGDFTFINFPGSLFTTAESANNSGVIAGTFTDVQGLHCFVRAVDGTFTSFDPPGIPSHQPYAISPRRVDTSGDIAGFSTVIDPPAVDSGFFRASSGTLTAIEAPGDNPPSEGTTIGDLNAGGVIVGSVPGPAVMPPAAPTSHSFLRAADGTYTVFDPSEAGPNGSSANGINDSGAIVGTYLDPSLVQHSYLRDSSGNFTVLDDPNAAQLPFSFQNTGTAAVRINSAGTIVGSYSDAAGLRHGFVRE
jgi:hypothetical protein